MKNESAPNYLPVLLEHLTQTPTVREGVHHVEVRHHDDCGMFHGKPCDCEPEIESGARVNRKYEGTL